MKLRNKNTGETVDIDTFKIETPLLKAGIESLEELNSIVKELNEEWEDYTPPEPLIKDPKIRKAVRAWAEANGIKNVAFEDYDDENIYFIDRDYEPQIWFPKKSIIESPLDDGKIYTITELCGEEEECES